MDLGELIVKTISSLQGHVEPQQLEDVKLISQAAMQTRNAMLKLQGWHQQLHKDASALKQSSDLINEILAALLAREGGSTIVRAEEMLHDPAYGYSVKCGAVPGKKGDVKIELVITKPEGAEAITPPGTSERKRTVN